MNGSVIETWLSASFDFSNLSQPPVHFSGGGLFAGTGDFKAYAQNIPGDVRLVEIFRQYLENTPKI